MDSENNENGLVHRSNPEQETASLTLSKQLLRGWTPGLKLINIPDGANLTELNKRLAVAGPQYLLADLLEFYSNLVPEKVAAVFKEGIGKIDDPELDRIHNYYQHYARPQKLAAQLSRLICGFPAFTNNNLGTLKSFPGIKAAGNGQISGDQILQAIKPLVRVINKAFAAAQLYHQSDKHPTGQPLYANFINLHKALEIPRPSLFYFRERVENLRQRINTFQVTDPQIMDRIAALEEGLQAMVLAKKYFGEKGPLIIMPTVAIGEKTAGHTEYGIYDKLSFLEDQLNYFYRVLNKLKSNDIYNNIQQEQGETNMALRDTLDAEEKAGADAGHVDLPKFVLEEASPESEKHRRVSKKFEVISEMYISVTNEITNLQGEDESDGEIAITRNQAEVAAGRLFEARAAVAAFLSDVSGHHSSWHEITASSKVSGLIKKALILLEKLRRRLLEIETAEISRPLDWKELKIAHRPSLPIGDFYQMTTNMEFRVTDLEASRMNLQQELEIAQSTREEQISDFASLMDSVDLLTVKLTEMSGKKCTLLDVYDTIKLQLVGGNA